MYSGKERGNIFKQIIEHHGGFPRGAVVKNLPANAGDARDSGFIPGSGRSSGVGNDLLQYSCLENPVDTEACWATVHSVAKSWT